MRASVTFLYALLDNDRKRPSSVRLVALQCDELAPPHGGVHKVGRSRV
jgi:hypothetical protein